MLRWTKTNLNLISQFTKGNQQKWILIENSKKPSTFTAIENIVFIFDLNYIWKLYIISVIATWLCEICAGDEWYLDYLLSRHSQIDEKEKRQSALHNRSLSGIFAEPKRYGLLCLECFTYAVLQSVDDHINDLYLTLNCRIT